MTDDTPFPWFVAIGASGTDGLRDIQDVLSALPPVLDAVVLVVLHRSWDHPSRLAEILNRVSLLPVSVARAGERFAAGQVYVGEPGDHLALAANSFGRLVYDPDRRYRNRTVDLLFRSVAEHGGSRMIGIVLSGALDDGARGLAAINETGGLTMVLTPSRSVGRGMPENAIAYDGPIDLIGSPIEIAAGIREAVQSGRRAWLAVERR
ncbi:chemotaxis protein CheB [Methylobacterium terricola]|uniref:protein-glutamate methylesterase n=1 Tax=Methylobacterium terricola TaxID=2583531 RepID=A0A5C4L981_9HYPH|nr:chemotaxis protein CheB [Methylobacterium terricola]TNC07622.1 chemotaxis protein CheB [Methylobacterium terricola]